MQGKRGRFHSFTGIARALEAKLDIGTRLDLLVLTQGRGAAGIAATQLGVTQTGDAAAAAINKIHLPAIHHLAIVIDEAHGARKTAAPIITGNIAATEHAAVVGRGDLTCTVMLAWPSLTVSVAV